MRSALIKTILVAACVVTSSLVGIPCVYAQVKTSGSAKPVVNKPIGDKWAIVIGVGKFQDPTIPSLKYPAKDARDFADCLVKKANFAPDHVRVICDEDATRLRILSEIGDKFLPRVVRDDDLVIIYFSSHGSPSDKDYRHENYLVAYDTEKNNLYATGIEMQGLTYILRDRVHSKRTLIIMDACHSGGGADGAKDFEQRGPNVKQLDLGYGQIVVSSSLNSERSWESKKYPNGVFTRQFIKAIENNPQQGSVGKLFADVHQTVEDEVRLEGQSQTPEMKGTWDGKELILTAPPASPQPLPSSVKELLSVFDKNKTGNPAAVVEVTKPAEITKPAVVAMFQAPTQATIQATSPTSAPAATPPVKISPPSAPQVSGSALSEYKAADGTFIAKLPKNTRVQKRMMANIPTVIYTGEDGNCQYQVICRIAPFVVQEQNLGYDVSSFFFRDSSFNTFKRFGLPDKQENGHLFHCYRIVSEFQGKQGEVRCCASRNIAYYFMVTGPNPGNLDGVDTFMNSIQIP
ncbi:MAG TPA: caspase family protein [Oculatellaceae cyanobacterium]